MIVANELTANASDQGVMLGLLDQVKDTLQEQPERVLADAATDRVQMRLRPRDPSVCVTNCGRE